MDWTQEVYDLRPADYTTTTTTTTTTVICRLVTSTSLGIIWLVVEEAVVSTVRNTTILVKLKSQYNI